MIFNRKFGIPDALQSLQPGAHWVLSGDLYEGLSWDSQDKEKPSEENINLEIERLQSEYDALNYQRSRKEEYPDFKDYLDGIVKNDQGQIDLYIASCLAIKEKYPKP